MIRFLYNLLFPVALIFFLPGLLAKMRRRGNYRRKFGQRFGLYDAEVRQRLRAHEWTWIHAVSVGEVMVALKLAAALRKSDPQIQIALTTTTTTGFALASTESPTWMEVIYSPLDFWPVMWRAFRLICPQQIILVEAEVWPNLVAFARSKKIPIALVNARLSARSEHRFRFFKFAFAPIFQSLDLICVPEPEDISRWETLGARRGQLRLTGNIKYDSEVAEADVNRPRTALTEFGIDPSRLIVLGGSTHAGEEKILAESFIALRTEFPALLLIIAPRHVERTPEICRELARLSLRIARRSAGNSMKGPEIDCLLLDTTGELQDWYSIATVTFVGKSLCAHGGQNPVEPLLAGTPVIFGPHMENFLSLSRSLVRQKAAVQITAASQLQGELARLLREASARAELLANAQPLVAQHRHATVRTAELIITLAARGASGRGK